MTVSYVRSSSEIGKIEVNASSCNCAGVMYIHFDD